MSLRYRCAEDTIARSIALAMKLSGGKGLISIRPSLLARYGCKRTRCQRFRIKRASRAQFSVIGNNTMCQAIIGWLAEPNRKTNLIEKAISQ